MCTERDADTRTKGGWQHILCGYVKTKAKKKKKTHTNIFFFLIVLLWTATKQEMMAQHDLIMANFI